MQLERRSQITKIKGADKGSAVFVWDREGYVKEASRKRKIKMSMRKSRMTQVSL